MLYPRNADKSLSDAVFLDPGSEYRGAPFWSWNTRLSKELLIPQIEVFQQMGMGGFHIHCRSGLATEYLSEEFLDIVEACNDAAKAREMLCWLYDEDRWPSGAAGGLVTADLRYRMRYLLFTPWPYGDARAPKPRDSSELRGAMIDRNSRGTLLARYAIRLEKGRLSEYRMLRNGEPVPGGFKAWQAYLEIAADQPWYNNQAYVNTLSRQAIGRFVQVTHERYRARLGKDFGKSVPAIFSDEPQFAHKSVLSFVEEERDLIIPFDEDFEQSYRAAYGAEFLATLPELFWEGDPASTNLVRYRYHDHLAERFAVGFADTVGQWCRANGIMLTGHMMEEPTLESQTKALGEAMRSYRSFQLPGIDMLSDRREYTTAKQAQSAARQLGAPGVLSELYGVTGWHFDFRGHKLQGDWQAALGVTVRVHHLTWASMGGEAKRDYPASIGYQSPWYREYRMVEDHFARLNTALTRGKARVRIAVIHPIESYWLLWGPREQTSIERDEMESKFASLTSWLLFGQLDFDFVAESLLPERAAAEGPTLRVGEMSYEAVVVPACRTIRSTTLSILERFRDGGGTLIFLGEPPALVSALPSRAPGVLAGRSAVVAFARAAILRALEPFRDIDVRRSDGSRHDNLLYQMRSDGSRRWLFLCHARPPANPDMPVVETLAFDLAGEHEVVLFDTSDGSHRGLPSSVENGHTAFRFRLAAHDSLLLALDPRSPRGGGRTPKAERGKGLSSTGAVDLLDTAVAGRSLTGPVEIELSEPNVLLLDRAEYRLEGEAAWRPAREILKIDNEIRRQLAWPSRGGRMAQPWVEPDRAEDRRFLSLRFRIHSEVAVDTAWLALERASLARIELNGGEVRSTPDGWFVDRAIEKVCLPGLPAGVSELIVSLPVTRREGAEWMYLLGDFGVRVAGAEAAIVPPVRKLSFGDWCGQGLPFYAGNVTYRLAVTGSGRFALQVAQFRNPLLSVSIDGRPAGKIAYSPYAVDLGDLGDGDHLIEIAAFGNRANAFGPIHNCNDTLEWWGPDSWRTSGWEWSEEYRLRRMGVLVAPRLIRRG